MEIHPPEKPLHSIKDVGLQLMTITIGILIALSLEGTLEWFHHRSLVREAKENITVELRDNRREIDEWLKSLPKMLKQQEQLLHFIDIVHSKQRASVKLEVGYVIPDLGSASWRTAEATGALGYMKYADVKKYSGIYGLQARLIALQDRTIEHIIAAMPPDEPEKASPAELAQWRQRVLAAQTQIEAAINFARTASPVYGKVLSEK